MVRCHGPKQLLSRRQEAGEEARQRQSQGARAAPHLGDSEELCLPREAQMGLEGKGLNWVLRSNESPVTPPPRLAETSCRCTTWKGIWNRSSTRCSFSDPQPFTSSRTFAPIAPCHVSPPTGPRTPGSLTQP
jgi:hypothetical protein